jgi:predicted nucleotidyltransferase
MNAAIERSRKFSETKLTDLRSRLAEVIPPEEVVLTCGSYARREASGASDIDFFIITQVSETHKLPWVEKAKAMIDEIIPIEPAASGAFANVEMRDSMLRNIGGDNDSNQKITRRMLFLLEGEWLFNASGLKSVRRQIIEHYIRSSMTDHQLALFLLNDIIRYYRTIAVDYEFKTVEGEKPKPWGIRNIKLVFSRKLLYASGLFSVAMTADRSREEKVSVLERLFELPVIDRLIDICGLARMVPVLNCYDHFLAKLEDTEIRTRLNGLRRDQRDDPVFRDLKNEGHHFTRELLKLFEGTFDSTHPIRKAVVF